MIPRHLQPHLIRLAKQYPVVTITGPRQSGKTTLCQAAFSNLQYVNLEDLDSRRFAAEDPRGFLAQYDDGVVLDEIQRVPELPSYIQGVVDRKNKPGLFILTGSQQFEVFNTISQSLAGRTAITKLLPFSYSEIYKSEKIPSLKDILYKGFYPRIHDKDLDPTEALSFYISTYLERDLRDLIHIRNRQTFERFLRICATQCGQLVNYSRIGNDCGIDQKTVKSWMSLLEASFIIFLLPPHSENFRKRMTKSPKLYFCDVGLAAYLVGIRSKEYIDSHPLKGVLFENFIIAELLKYRFNNVSENNLFFFRDHIGNEIDLILDYGRDLIPIEIKSGRTLGTDFFKGLTYYSKLSKSRSKTPCLIYGGTESQKRFDVRVFSYQHLSKLFKTLPK